MLKMFCAVLRAERNQTNSIKPIGWNRSAQNKNESTVLGEVIGDASKLVTMSLPGKPAGGQRLTLSIQQCPPNEVRGESAASITRA
jgi:hypothetical protein